MSDGPPGAVVRPRSRTPRNSPRRVVRRSTFRGSATVADETVVALGVWQGSAVTGLSPVGWQVGECTQGAELRGLGQQLSEDVHVAGADETEHAVGLLDCPPDVVHHPEIPPVPVGECVGTGVVLARSASDEPVEHRVVGVECRLLVEKPVVSGDRRGSQPLLLCCLELLRVEPWHVTLRCRVVFALLEIRLRGLVTEWLGYVYRGDPVVPQTVGETEPDLDNLAPTVDRTVLVLPALELVRFVVGELAIAVPVVPVDQLVGLCGWALDGHEVRSNPGQCVDERLQFLLSSVAQHVVGLDVDRVESGVGHMVGPEYHYLYLFGNRCRPRRCLSRHPPRSEHGPPSQHTAGI